MNMHDTATAAALATGAQGFHRSTYNVVVTGHRNVRAMTDTGTTSAVHRALDTVMAAFTRQAMARAAALRMVTGYADGSDALAASVAQAQQLPLQIIAPCPPSVIDRCFARGQAITLMAAASDTPAESWVAATDDAKLALGDALVVIWDGGAPRGTSGGAVRLLIEALQRHLPVVWIDCRAGAAGTVRLLDLQALDAATLVMLGANEHAIGRHQHLFRDIGAAPLDAALAALLAPFWGIPANVQALLEQLARPTIDPGEQTSLAGFVHSSFLSLCSGAIKVITYGKIDSYSEPELVGMAGSPAAMWPWFARFDRAATLAGYWHRDQIVAIHLFSSFAVLGAVAGAITTLSWGTVFWALFELLMVLGIGAILWKDKRAPKQQAWLQFRQAAEALRLSALVHPMLGSLSALHRVAWVTDEAGQLQPAKPYYWLVVQVLREASYPSGRSDSVEQRGPDLRARLDKVIKGQVNYHKGKHEKWHKAHESLHWFNNMLFFVVLVAIGAHLFALGMPTLEHHVAGVPAWLGHAGHWIHEQRWLLLLTAVLPALGAGLHSILTKLEIERVAINSHNMQQRLGAVRAAATLLDDGDGPIVWRGMAIEAADLMYAEHQAWAELMEIQKMGAPA